MSSAKSSLEESGVNTLFLVLGFLEWLDLGNEKELRQAQLYMILVEIDREFVAGEVKYHIKIREEDPVENITLKLKFKNDFGLELPDYNAESDPETCFQACQAVLSNFETMCGVNYS